MSATVNDLRWIGTIQDLGKPYADLYLDGKGNRLFLLVRVSDASDADTKYVALSVSPTQVIDYMDGNGKIADIFSSCPCRYAALVDNHIQMEGNEFLSSPSTFRFNLPFDPTLCLNRVKLKVAMRRMSQLNR